MRRSRADRFLGLGPPALVGSFAVLLACVLVVSFGLQRLAGSRNALLARDGTIGVLEALQRDVRMAETGQRGYLLTQDPGYLTAYGEGRRRTPADLAALSARPLPARERAEAAAIERLVRLKLNELATTVSLNARSPAAALALVRSGLGQRYMDEIDARVDALVSDQREALRAETRREQQIATVTATAAGASALLAICAGAAGILLIMRQRRLTALQALNATLEQRVEERTARLTAANEELDAFAYTISHDLRAPLRAIHGYADVIEEDAGTRLTEELREYLSRIVRAADQMNRLIEDILAYAKLSKEEALAVRPVGLDGVVARARQQLERACENAEIHVAEPLGEVLAHPAALQQIVENLLSNACKYVAPGVNPQVRIWTELDGAGRRRLWVEDNGIGIAPEHFERIFKPFERLHGIEAYPGTGIGLAIVRRSIERMGGRCGVEPRAGSGSRFWIELAEPRAE